MRSPDPAPTPGADADSPTEVATGGWLDVGRRVKARFTDDHVPLLAAGVGFFGLLAVIPALTAAMAVYGLVADPADVPRQVDQIAATVPEDARRVLVEQLQRLVSSSTSGLSLTLIGSILVALWSASSGTRHLMEAVNEAYAEEPERKMVRGRLRALAFTVVLIVGLVIVLALVTALPAVVSDRVPAGQTVADVLRWPVVALAMLALLALLYRKAPRRQDARWRWVTPGSIVALVLWLAASVGLAVYASSFGRFEKTYGSLAAVIVTMLWLFLSSLSVLLGAYVNAELEHQTEADSTTGPRAPMGARGATMADDPAPGEEPIRAATRR